MIEVQCTSCHTRYRIDEQVLPEGTPTFKCSRCGHVFTFEPRKSQEDETQEVAAKVAPQRIPHSKPATKAESEPEPMVETPPPASAADGTTIANIDEMIPPAAWPAETLPPTLSAEPSEVQPDPAEPRQPAVPASRTEEFFSRLFAGKDEELKPGDSLTFDFRDEQPSPAHAALDKPNPSEPPPEPPESKKWEVGDDSAFDAEAFDRNTFGAAESAPLFKPRRKLRAPDLDDEDDFVRDEEAPVYNRAVTHSARFFLMMLFLAAAGFGAVTLLIHNAPAAAADILSRFPVIGGRFVTPTTPGRLVALRDVRADYQRSKDNRTALVITGTAENVGLNPLHVIQVAVNLRDSAQRPIASRAVYCGNNLSAKMVADMTPHEIEFFQKLDPPKAFTLDPSGACPLVIVFIDPPQGVSRFDISVAQA